MNLDDAVPFAVVLPTLLAAHQVADFWIQTDWQARTKGQRDAMGRLACAAHVATYTLTTIAMVSTVWLLFNLPISPAGFLVGQAVSAVTHYWADRRFTLQWLCERLGKSNFYRLGAPRAVEAWLGDLGSHEIKAVNLCRVGQNYPVPWDNPSLGTGAYALDQSWHWFWLFIAALLTVLL